MGAECRDGRPGGPGSSCSDYAHRVIADIADRQLTSAARAQVVADLMRSQPLLATPLCPVSDLADASVWADCVRGRYRERFSARAPWHYVNVPVCGAFELSSCRDGDCITAALERQIEVLGDRRAPRPRRVEALNWIVHLIGDLHQPLHVGDNGDRGGNQIEVELPGIVSRYPLNLHGAWDRQLAELAIDTYPGGVDALVASAPSVVGASRGETLHSWAAETWALSRSHAYRPLRIEDLCSTRVTSVRLGDAYISQSQPVIRLQVQRAGVRLAAVLNTALVSPRRRD